MNRFLLALFAVVLCTTVLAQEHDNRAIVETAYASFARGDVAAFLDILDTGVTWVVAEDVVSVEPHVQADDANTVYRGIEAVRARHSCWLTTHGIEDLCVDGPFVTGNHFALFIDMLVVHAGQRTPHSQIAVRNGKIVEERFFS